MRPSENPDHKEQPSPLQASKEKDSYGAHPQELLWQRLIQILSDEASIYDELLLKERNKRLVIQKQETDRLRDISMEQDGLLRERDVIEKERFQIFAELKLKKLDDIFKINLPEEVQTKLNQLKNRLRASIQELQSMVNTNQEMILHNTGFFQSLLEGAARSSADSATYDLKENKKGNREEQESPKPVFLNANC